jgi:hypothetical protein
VTADVVAQLYETPIASHWYWGNVQFREGDVATHGGRLLLSYTQKLWMRVKRKAAYLPG